MLLLALPCTIGLALTAEYTVPLLFGEAFLPSVDTLRILSVLVLVFSVAYFLGHIVLTATGLERKILRATIAGAIINAVANLLLIPNLQQNGAAIASVLSEVAVTVILLWHARDCYRLTIGKNYIYSTIAALGILIAAVSGMKLLLKEPWMVLIIIPVAAVLYFGCLLVMRNEAVMELVAKVKNKR
jgi:O-antigen/teichoic acid export membrane protein